MSQVIGITQADMPDDYYGWIQTSGTGFITVSGQTKPAYADFEPNDARLHLSEGSSKSSQGRPAELPPRALDEWSLAQHRYERLSQLPPLLIEVGAYCDLLREARAVFVDGHFYACVAMCGIAIERFQRDKAEPYGARPKWEMPQVRRMLTSKAALMPETLVLCDRMAKLRNKYAHGGGLKPKEDALKALAWMHSFISNETNLMRDYTIENGVLTRKRAETARDPAT